MKYSFALLSLAALAMAAPTPQADDAAPVDTVATDDSISDSPAVSTPSSAPATLNIAADDAAGPPVDLDSLGPTLPLPPPGAPTVDIPASIISRYSVWTGAIAYNVQVGRIRKTQTSSDITTLATFYVNPVHAGRKCSFHFELGSSAVSTLTGTRTFDIFTSLKPASKSTTSWPPGNQRDQHVGRMRVSTATRKGSYLTDGFPTQARAFPCPAGVLAGELVGTGDQINISWNKATSKGPFIRVSNW